MTSHDFVNGKWLAQAASGTQRYATEVMKAATAGGRAEGLTLVIPCDAEVPSWAAGLRVIRSRLRGAAFEQLALPWISRTGHLYSFAGPASILRRDQTVVMHDAMPFRHPETFRPAFVWWYRLMYGVLSRSTRRLFTVSRFSREELASVLGVPEDRFGIAPCGADHVSPEVAGTSGAPLPRPPGAYLLLVGNLAPHKNTAAALRALGAAKLPVLVVGSAQDQVFRNVDLPQLDDVVFLGRVDDARLQQLYANAAALVAPSRYEGFGIPVVEAGRLGCPSIVASGSALEDVVGDGGLVFERDDLGACADLARRLLADRTLRDELGQRARANAARFSWASTAAVLFEQDPTVRVLHVTETFSAGTGSAIVGFAASTADQGIDSVLLAQDRGSGLLGSLPRSPFSRARILVPGLLNLWRAVGPTVREVRPDVVHAHSSLAGAVVRLRLAARRKPRVVYSPHCFAFERRDVARPVRLAFRVVERALARVTDAFVCVSPHEAKLAAGLAPRAPVVSLVNVFEVLSPAPARRGSARQWQVACMGRVMPQKDPAMFATIVARLTAAEPGTTGRWIGAGTDEGGMAALQAAGVEVTGWLAPSAIGDALAEASVYVHTASWEAGPPIAVLDAIRAGLPVVVRRSEAYDEVLPASWQFDTVDEAVAMTLALRDPARLAAQVDDQWVVLQQLAGRSPGAVLAQAYRDVSGRAAPPRSSSGKHEEASVAQEEAPVAQEWGRPA